MKALKLVLSGAMAAGALAVSVPAAAQPGDHWDRHHHRHHRAHPVRVCHAEWRHHHRIEVCHTEWRR